MSDVTCILSRIETGEPKAAEQLLPLVYDELRKLAAARLAQEKPGQTLQATALVHEAYLRLVVKPGHQSGDQQPDWRNRGYFFAAAAEAMRRILIERARHKQRPKRGGDLRRVDLGDVAEPSRRSPAELLALDKALRKLTVEDPQKAQLVELRYFAGLTHEQAAEVLGISAVTAKRHWRYARAWLQRELQAEA